MLDFPASPMMARDLTLIFLHVPNNVHWQIFFHIFSLLSFSCSTYTFDPRGPEVFFLLHMLWMLCISLLGESGSHVALKQLYRDSEDHLFEEDIACHLSSDPLSKDSHNYCVPLLDVLYPHLKDDDPHLQILVMPFLCLFDMPIFNTFGEAIECIRQLFKVRFLYSL